jgi:hypothetical protein
MKIGTKFTAAIMGSMTFASSLYRLQICNLMEIFGCQSGLELVDLRM